MPRTYVICTESGIYESQCEHQELIRMAALDRFPGCEEGGHSVEWKFVRAE